MPTTGVPMKLVPSCQSRLEGAVRRVIEDPKIRKGEKTVLVKDASDEQIRADLVAEAHYKQVAGEDNAIYISEESYKKHIALLQGNGSRKKLVYVCDPIDGSTEFSRAGPMRSPLTTAIMAIQDTQLLAAAVGDVWSREIYCIGLGRNKGPRLYMVSSDSRKRTYLSVSAVKRRLTLEKAMVAAYAPGHKDNRIDLLLPLFRQAPYIHNNGGQPFALRVVAGLSEKSYAVALELVPVGLWEHIGPILASAGGATVRRLDGQPLALDPLLKQTGITAASKSLADAVQKALASSYSTLNVAHHEPLR